MKMRSPEQINIVEAPPLTRLVQWYHIIRRIRDLTVQAALRRFATLRSTEASFSPMRRSGDFIHGLGQHSEENKLGTLDTSISDCFKYNLLNREEPTRYPYILFGLQSRPWHPWKKDKRRVHPFFTWRDEYLVRNIEIVALSARLKDKGSAEVQQNSEESSIEEGSSY